MAILVADDFNSFAEVKVKLSKTPEELDDARIQTYWDDLAKYVGVSPDDLPVEPGVKVKDYLIWYTASVIASKNGGSNLTQISEGVVVDQWAQRARDWTNMYNTLRANIQTSDVIDPAKLDDAETKNSMVVTWSKG